VQVMPGAGVGPLAVEGDNAGVADRHVRGRAAIAVQLPADAEGWRQVLHGQAGLPPGEADLEPWECALDLGVIAAASAATRKVGDKFRVTISRVAEMILLMP
jgi:hypothetical protein